MSADDKCECGRRRHTEADLQRWEAEIGPGVMATDPPWAQEICWTKAGVRCNMRPVAEVNHE